MTFCSQLIGNFHFERQRKTIGNRAFRHSGFQVNQMRLISQNELCANKVYSKVYETIENPVMLFDFFIF